MSDRAFAPAAIDINLIDVDVLPVHVHVTLNTLNYQDILFVNQKLGKVEGKVLFFLQQPLHNDLHLLELD